MKSNRKHIEVIATLLMTTLFSASTLPISEAALSLNLLEELLTQLQTQF